MSPINGIVIMVNMKKLMAAFIFALTSLNVAACIVYERQYRVHFEPGSATVTAKEIKRFVEWRIATRKYFFSGFDVYLTAWESEDGSRELATARVEQVRNLLLKFGLSANNVKDTEFRPIYAASVHYGPDLVRIDVDARCPNYCCRDEKCCPAWRAAEEAAR